jgi:sugar (pentulose or hexulose) kinase
MLGSEDGQDTNFGCNKQSISVQINHNQSLGGMMAAGWTIVLDVGKTHSKATLWNEAGMCVDRRSRPNQQPNSGGGLTLDAAGIERWLERTLKEFATLGAVSAIVPVAHGAGAALIQNGRLLCAPVDYEWPGVARERTAYDKQRDPFVATGSPTLPAGLNLGMQIHWLESLRSGNYCSAQILPWAQYWAWLLSGVATSEVTSLGCHTDLWRPYDRAPSELAIRRGWAERLAPLTPAGAVLGELTPEWVKRTGLSGRVKIHCGLHDSNAALLAARSHHEIEEHDTTVLSTGTWFVAMRSPLKTDLVRIPELQEFRDCLVNVDVSGVPVPSSRFMGGREIEILVGKDIRDRDAHITDTTRLESAIRAIDHGEMILPSSVPGVGPFPNARSHRVGARPITEDATILAQLYAALVADVSLDLIGSHDTLVIDGRFSQAAVFVQALARLRPETTVLISKDDNGVAHGALRLVNRYNADTTALERVPPLPADMADYRARWREAAERTA